MLRTVLPLLALTASHAWAQPGPPIAPASAPASAAAAVAPQPGASAAFASAPFASAPVAPMPAAPPVAVAPPVPAPAPPAPVVVPPHAAIPQAPPAAVARTPAPPAPPMPPVKGLPSDAPKLVVNGGTYSERRDMRTAIVNGTVVREGANVDGVVVEQIRPDGLVLAYRGSRFHVLY